MKSALELERRRWLRMNRRILTVIGEKTFYGRTMVSQVFNGHRNSDGSIEAELRELGAPGWGTKKPMRKA